MAPEERGIPQVARGKRIAKTKKVIHPGLPSSKVLDLVDVFLFLADARAPWTSVRLAAPFLTRQKRVYVLAKPDLADPGLTDEWLTALRERGTPSFAVDCRTGGGIDGLLAYLKEKREQLNASRAPGVSARPVRIMLFGPPNVGKSSLANRLLGTQKAPYGAKPGLTRGSRWLRGRGFLEVLDTPGVVQTSQVKDDARMKLAAVWALADTAYQPEDVALWLMGFVGGGGEAEALGRLEDFARQRGFLRQGGAVDMERTSRAYLKAFREGDLGRITLEKASDFMQRAQQKSTDGRDSR